MKNNNTFFWGDAVNLAQIKLYLSRNELVVGTSDTVFGLLANVTEEAFGELNQLKARAEKPYIVLVSGIEKLTYFTDQKLSSDIINLLNFCWPGPLTMIFQAKSSLPSYMVSQDYKIALRVPHHAGLQALLVDFMGLFSTSANLSGQPVPHRIDLIDPKIIQAVSALVLDQVDQDGCANDTQPSTILDCSGDQIRVVRAGAYAVESLERLCQKSFQK